MAIMPRIISIGAKKYALCFLIKYNVSLKIYIIFFMIPFPPYLALFGNPSYQNPMLSLTQGNAA